MDSQSIKIKLSYSDDEWGKIEKILEAENCKDLRQFFNKKLRNICDNKNNVIAGDEVIIKRCKNMRLPPYISKMITQLQKKHQIAPAALLSKLVINPALKEYNDKNGY